ncbi:hypothetical protein [Aquipuribacter sp. SD81]|uniref:hypothetical protein n=1 Tax=Aquipuribacter sp. SD81 TaxID=3127703 RepID=UPI003016ECAA
MPVAAACLVPAAPVLLPWLTGTDVPEVEPVRAAVTRALDVLDDCDRVLLVAHERAGTLAGFGSVLPSPVPSRARGSWPHELAHALLDSRPGHPAMPDWRPGREETSWPRVAGDPAGWLAQQDAVRARTGLLLLADGSRTRGPRAPGGEDPRGGVVDRALAAAVRGHRRVSTRARRAAPAVGADACDAVDVLAAVGGRRPPVLHLADAPLGVGYLVATWRLA